MLAALMQAINITTRHAMRDTILQPEPCVLIVALTGFCAATRLVIRWREERQSYYYYMRCSNRVFVDNFIHSTSHIHSWFE